MVSPATRGNLAALAVAVGVSLLAGEAILRAVVELPLTRRMPEMRYDPHPVRRFTLRPAQTGYTYGASATVDARGFRVNGPEQRERDGTTIFALGDSFTFGMGVGDEETWPAQLERRLGHSGHAVDVINGGTISYGVFQELDLLKTAGLATRPRLVVHALYWNDFMNAEEPVAGAPDVVTPAGYLSWDGLDRQRSWLARQASWASSRSALLFSAKQAAQALVDGRGARTGYGSRYASFLERGLSPEDWKPIEAFYQELKRLGAEHGFRVLAVVMPVSDIAMGDMPLGHPYRAEARTLLRGLDIPIVDGFEVVAARQNRASVFLPEGADAHLNGAGYELIAAAVERSVRGRDFP